MIGMMKERRRKGVFCMKIGVARSNEVKARAFADDASPTPRGEKHSSRISRFFPKINFVLPIYVMQGDFFHWTFP